MLLLFLFVLGGAFRWGFLALYFIPGLTEDQRNQYIQRLGPDRQQFLNRPGLGYLLGGEGFMRALVGDQQWRRQAIERSISLPPPPEPLPPPPPEPLPPPPRSVVVLEQQQQQALLPLQIAASESETPFPRRLDFDSDDNESMASSSVVGLTIEAIHDEGDNNNSNDHNNFHNNNNNDDDEEEDEVNNEEQERQRQRQLDEEGQVVVSALFTGTWSYVSWLAGIGGEAAYDRVVEPTSSLVSAAGIGVSALSLGLGFWGISTGFYNRPGSSTTSSFRASSLLPSSRVLVGTALFGGISAGVMLYARTTVRNAVKTPTKPPAPKNSQGGGGNDKK